MKSHLGVQSDPNPRRKYTIADSAIIINYIRENIDKFNFTFFCIGVQNDPNLRGKYSTTETTRKGTTIIINNYTRGKY